MNGLKDVERAKKNICSKRKIQNNVEILTKPRGCNKKDV